MAIHPEATTTSIFQPDTISNGGGLPCSPLLPAAATGTVDTKSIVDPIRGHLDRSCNYFKAEAKQINVKVLYYGANLQSLSYLHWLEASSMLVT